MKAILATMTICALPALSLAAYAQARGGGGSAAGAGSVGSVGRPVGVPGGTVSVPGGTVGVPGGTVSAASGSTVVSPTGNLAGRPGIQPGTALSAPAGGPVTTPSTITPIGPLNPGGLSGLPPQTVGRTFDRSTIGGAPLDTITDPAGPQPVFGFPPASSLPQSVVTNTVVGGTLGLGLPDFRTFPPGVPVGVGNTVGRSFDVVNPAAVPREPVAVNLPPGARVVTNTFGVAEAIVPAPSIISTNAVGRGPTFESSSARQLPVPQRTAPPRNPPIR